jgi:hypothetical protein
MGKHDIVLSKTINQPLMSLGFHHFIHKLRTELITFTKSIKSENQFYYVVNPFEINISNYNEGINHLAQIYLNQTKTFNRSFFKMWEILFSFDIMCDKNFTHVAINDNNDVVMLFRKKFNIANKTDKTMSVGIDDTKIPSDKVSLITCNVKPNTNPEHNTQEQSTYIILIKAIVIALKMQEEKGCFVLRIFDTFTKVTIKLISLLSCFYEEIYIYKPYFSRETSSEKYVICRKFKKQKTDYKKFDKMVDSIKDNIFDIFPDFELDDAYLNAFKFMNIRLVTSQQIVINRIITYIKENNYYGDKYHTYRDNQIKAIEWWVRMFFPPSNNIYETNKKDLAKHNQAVQHKHSLEINMFAESLQ